MLHKYSKIYHMELFCRNEKNDIIPQRVNNVTEIALNTLTPMHVITVM